jgi:hypothetical protein
VAEERNLRSPLWEAVNTLRGSAVDRKDWNGYILPPIGEDIPPLPEAVAAFKEAFTEAGAAEGRRRAVMTEGGCV